MDTLFRFVLRSLPFLSLLVATPALALNGTITITFGNGGGTVQGIFATILTIINGYVVPLIFAIAFVVFLWGLFQYFIAGGADEEKRKQGRQLILWGLIGFFVMFALWGLVNILLQTFGLNSSSRPCIPTAVSGVCL